MLRPYYKLATDGLAGSLRSCLLRTKVHVARRLKEVTDPARRDFFNSPRARKHRKEPTEEHNKITSLEDAKPLSQYEKIDDRYEEVQYSAKKYNKDTKDSIKFKLDESFEAMAVRELQHPDTIISPEADKLNRINAAEYEKYRLEYYRKNELSRLLRKAQKHQQVGLYGPGYQDNSNFVTKILQEVKTLEEQRRHTGNHAMIEDVRISEMGNYQAELRNLKNDRIDGLLGLHNSNPKLKELMEHGFMDKSKSIGEVFHLLQEAKTKKLASTQKRSLFPIASSLLQGIPTEQTLNPTEQSLSLAEVSQSKEGNSPARSSDNTQVSYIQKEIQDKYRSLVGDDPNKQTAMEMVLQSMEERGLRGSNHSNYHGLVEFVQGFMEMDQQDKADLLERVARVQQVREFEERILKEREVYMLEGRGTPTFDSLKPEERVQYVKHNVHLYQDIFKIVKSHEQAVKNDPAFAAALIEKLAMGWSLAPLFYKNSDYVDLHTVSKPEYMTLMKQVKNNLPEYGFHEFARIVFGFGKIHSREMGQLTGGLFEALTKKVVVVMANHLDRYLSIDRTQLGEGQESAMFFNLGILLEGLTSLGCVTATLPEQLYHKVLAVLAKGITSVSEGCTMNRILAFLLQTRRVMGHSMDRYVSPITHTALVHFATSELHHKLARPEQIDLAHALIGINKFPSLLSECKPEFGSLVVSIREDLVKNKEKLHMVSLADTTTLLVLLQSTNQLDIPAKNAVKLKFRHELVLTPNVMSYVVPRAMECLAIAELKDANRYYGEYSNPAELLYMKSLFGIRASEFDRTPKFEVYEDMYKFVASHAEKLNKKELLSLIDALCVIELPIETFNFALLEKTVQEMMSKKPEDKQGSQLPTKGQEFDTQLGSRMALLYSILGVSNLQDKWTRLTLEAIQSGSKFTADSALEIILTYDHHSSEAGSEEPQTEILKSLFQENFDLLVSQSLKYMKSMSNSKKVLLAWKLSELNSLNADILESVLSNVDSSALRALDKLLLSQVEGAEHFVTGLKEETISEFYDTVFFKASNMIDNDANTLYWKLLSALKDAKTAYKEKVVLKEKDAFRFIPLYLPQKKECLMVYAEDLFLRHLEMSQTIDQGFRYKMVKSNRLPPFFERNEAMLTNLGLKVQRMSSTTAKAKFSVLDSDLELAGFDELAAKKRVQYAQPDPKPQPSIESSTEPPKSARKRSATPKTPQSGDLPLTAANKTLKKPKKTEAN